MQSVVVLAFTVVSFFVMVLNWSRIRKPDILYPSVVIALIGGVGNAISTSRMEGATPGLLTYAHAVGVSLLITASGLYLAEKSRLPGLWPQADTTFWQSPTALRQPGKPACLAIGGMLGAALGVSLWLLARAGGPGPVYLLRAIGYPGTAEGKMYTALMIIQSGFIEEPMFRLFAIAGLAESLSSAGVDPAPRLIAGLLASSLLFGFIPPHNFLVSLPVGVLLGLTYMRLGLVPTIVAHCVANAVQLPLLLRMAWR